MYDHQWSRSSVPLLLQGQWYHQTLEDCDVLLVMIVHRANLSERCVSRDVCASFAPEPVGMAVACNVLEKVDVAQEIASACKSESGDR